MSRALQLAARLPSPVRALLQRLPGASRLFQAGLGSPGGSPQLPGTLRHVVYLPTWLRWDRMPERPQLLLAAMAATGHPVSFVDLHTAPKEVGGVSVVSDLGAVPSSGVAIYIHYPPHADHVGIFDEAVVIYDILDDLSLYDRQRAARRGHDILMATADVVIASSQVLADRHRAQRADIVVVPNGVDAARFGAGGERPADLGEGTIIGYHGAVERWFDFDLLQAVATSRPEWRFVVVGPIGDDVIGHAEEAGALPNVEFLGERPAATMPAYVAGFSASAIWFEVNELTTAVSPLKMYESLAGRTPVVSVPLPTALAEPGVRTASGPVEFAEQLDAALGGEPPPAPAAADWQRRTALLTAVLDERGLRRAKG